MKRILPALILFSLSESRAAGESWAYRENTGEKITQWKLTLEEDSLGRTVKYASPKEEDVFLCDSGFATREWRHRNAGEGTEWVATRKGDRIHVSGKRKGEPLAKEIEINAAHWYQQPYVALSRLALSQDPKCNFWVLRPDDLKPIKMVGNNMGSSDVKVGDENVSAKRIKMTLEGFLSWAWSASYWFNSRDGRWVRYEGVNGLPGSPKTVVQLQK
jgi:hypothetical protein